MKKQGRYEVILQDCLLRVLENGEPLQQVLREYPQWAEELSDEIETAMQIREQQACFDPRPGFLSSTRQALFNQREQPFKRNLRSSSLRYGLIPRFLLAATILLMAFLGGGMAAMAAEDALPGSSLYAVRKAVESFQLLLILEDSKEAEVHLELAQAYLVDYAVLASQGHWEDATLALQQYDRHISRTSRILRDLSGSKDEDFNALFELFNRTYLGDIEIFQVLSTGEL